MVVKLPVPTETLDTSDIGAGFQTKINALFTAVKNSISSYNAQIDAAATATTQAIIATEQANRASSIVLTPLLQIRKSKLDNPLVHLFKKNKLIDTLAGALTWTRATTATYIDMYGRLQTAAIDEPRQERDGWLIEGASTNLAINGSLPLNWTATSFSKELSPANDLTNLPAVKYTPTIGTGTKTIHIPCTAEAGGSLSQTFIVKAGELGIIQLGSTTVQSNTYYLARIDLFTGLVVSGGQYITQFRKIEKGAYIVTCTFPTEKGGTASPTCQVFDNAGNQTWTSDGTKGLYFYCVQLETKPFPSSYIPTTTAPATRASEMVYATFDKNHPDLTSNLSDFSYSLKASILGVNPLLGHGLVHMDSGIQYSMLRFKAGTTNITYYRDGGGITASTGASANQLVDIAVTVLKDNTTSIYTDCVFKVTRNQVPLVNTSNPANIIIGIFGGEPLFGHIQDLRIYDFALNADEVQFLAGE